jgi:CheY-like chemotaxis protein
LLAKAAGSDAALADLNRLTGAATKLAALIEDVASSADAQGDAVLSFSVERTLSRLWPQTAQPAHADGTLLVVDDNVMNRDLLTRQLVREGYNVFTAASGREALEKLRLHDFDLVLLDVIMPEMDGVQVLEQIQDDATLSEVPVVMISALDEIQGVARCLEKGAADYLTKPFDPVLLRARLSSTLQIHRLREDLRRSEDELAQSRGSAQRLARSLLPPPLLEGFERGEPSALSEYSEVTAIVVRLEGIDAIASRRASETAALVTQALALFEQCAHEKGFELTRATDRSCTAIAGAPQWNEMHAELAADFALDLRARFRDTLAIPLAPLQIRIGLHTGVLVTGLAGMSKLVCGMWGDSVTTADAIASHAPLGSVQLSASTCAKLADKFVLESPATIEVAGHGHLRTHQLKVRKTLPAASPQAG